MAIDSTSFRSCASEAACAVPAADTARVLVRGVANSGKTSLACAHVRDLLEAGVPAGEILVVAPTSTAARDMAGELGESAQGVRVYMARDFELVLLGMPEARAVVGRRPHVLCDFEESFLLEDMRATGVPARRLKGMLGFFRKSLTELADDDMASFIIDPREQAVLDALYRHLGAYDAILDCEVSNLAVRSLRAHPEMAGACGVRHIVADDYHCLNRASQVLLDLLKPATLWAFADETLERQGADPFPYPAGIAEFGQRNPEVVAVELAAPATGAVAAASQLASSGYLGALSLGLVESRGKVETAQAYEVAAAARPVEGVSQRVYAGPDEEVAGVAAYVAGLVEEGADPADICVLAPNRAWFGRVCRALREKGIALEEHDGRRVAGGSFRDLDACRTGRMYTALALLADPNDSLAWRCWCGCGDYLARSNIFTGIEELARQRGIGLGEALGLLDEGMAPEVPGQESTLVAYRQGRAMIDELGALHGSELLARLAEGLGMEAVPSVYAGLVVDAAAGEDAGATDLLACAQALAQGGVSKPGAVRVAMYDQASALKAAHVVVCGLMNGWMPDHAYFDLAEADFDARAALDAQARADMYRLASCATGDLVFTGFARCDLELAERTRLKGYKVAMSADGKRTTTVRPSDLLTYALHAWGLAPLPSGSLLKDFTPARVNA